MVRNELRVEKQPTPGIWDWTKDNDQVWLMRQAKSRDATNFWSGRLEPAVWMKKQRMLTNGGSLLRSIPAYADLLARYVRNTIQVDLDISAVSIPTNQSKAELSVQCGREEMRISFATTWSDVSQGVANS